MNGFRHTPQKIFRPPFVKGGAVEAAEVSSRSAERETSPLRCFLFVNFFFAPTSRKEKVADKSIHFDKL